jgi:hypothetical protein
MTFRRNNRQIIPVSTNTVFSTAFDVFRIAAKAITAISNMHMHWSTRTEKSGSL